MAITTVDSSGGVHVDSIPIVDLRFLSQSELKSLSLSSGENSDHLRRRFDDIIVPKIDRSVFNESAGSRKQTYSRLRLAPRPSDSSPVARRRRRLLPEPTSVASDFQTGPDHDREKTENRLIVGFLRNLLRRENPGGETLSEPSNEGASTSRAIVVYDSSQNVEMNETSCDQNVEIYNRNGILVDLGALEGNGDLFGEVLRRRTSGLGTEAELLEFLSGLNGTWGSRRKKRKVVDADEFGDDLPRGWKVLLGLRRKVGRVWLYCRRFISPNGQQFASSKEVASFLRPYVRTQDERQPTSNHIDDNIPEVATRNELVDPTHDDGVTREVPICYAAVPISSIATPSRGQQVVLFRVENPAKAQLRNLLECRKCNLSFDNKETHVKHLLSVHHRNAKRTRFGKSVGDGVIMNDGKYECQFCHKIFDERRRYNSHVGIHVRNYMKSLEEIPDEIIVQTSIDPSVMAVMPPPVVLETSTPINVLADSGSISIPVASAVNHLNASPPHGKLESGVQVENSSVSGALETTFESKNTETSSNTMDVEESNACLNDATPIPATDEASDHEMDEDKAWIVVETNDSTMDVDPRPSLNYTTSIPTNLEIDKEATEANLGNNVEPTSSTMNVDCSESLIHTIPLPTNQDKGQVATEDRSDDFVETSNNTMNVNPYSSFNQGALMHVEEKTTEENSYEDINDINNSRNQKHTHPDEEQSGVSTTCDKYFRKESVLDKTERSGNEVDSAIANNLITLPVQMSSLETENCVGDTFGRNLEKPDKIETSELGSKMVIDLGSSCSGSDKIEVSVTENIGNVDEEILLKSVVADAATPLMQPSSCFDLLSKDEDEFITVGQKLGNMTGFEELRLEDIGPLTSQDAASLPVATMDLTCGIDLEPELDTSIHFDWDTDLPKIVAPQQLVTVCVWCRAEFNHEGINPETQSDSVGFMCPSCKAKISGQMNILDNGLSL